MGLGRKVVLEADVAAKPLPAFQAVVRPVLVPQAGQIHVLFPLRRILASVERDITVFSGLEGGPTLGMADAVRLANVTDYGLGVRDLDMNLKDRMNRVGKLASQVDSHPVSKGLRQASLYTGRSRRLR